VKDLFYHSDPLQTLREQGVDLDQPASDAAGGEAPVPGTGTPTEPAAAETPAEAQKTETPQQGGPPEAIPYSRFKEVNDQLRPFKDIEALGYDVDSLRQLADWGIQFDLNPVDSWLAIAEQLEDLPEPIQAAVQEYMGVEEPDKGQTTPQPKGQQTDEDGEPPSWFKPIQEKVERVTEYVETAEQEAVDREKREILDGLLNDWKTADQSDGIRSPADSRMLTFISAHAAGANSIEDLLSRARGEWLEEREDILNGSVKREPTGAPVRVPGSGAPVQEGPPKPKTLAEANALVEAAAQAGTLDLGTIGK
jgi:hypothetical protein